MISVGWAPSSGTVPDLHAYHDGAAPGREGQSNAPAPGAAGRIRPTQRWLTAVRSSGWAPVALRVAGICALMLGLAGIGAAHTLLGNRGAPVSGGEAPAADGSWLAPVAAIGVATRAQGDHAPTAQSGERVAGRLASDAGVGAGLTPDGKVILNLACAEELRRIPGVGARRADAIVELRTRLKRFRKLTDLLRVRGIGVRSLRRMQPHVVLDAPAERSDGGAAEGGG